MKKFGTKDNRLVGTARNLRLQSTDVERKLWYRLRDRQIEHCKFRRQHPIAGYVLDFACEEQKLAIELDGGQHNRPDALKSDAQRTEALVEEGWRVLRFWNHEVIENIEGVLETVRAALTRKT